MEKVLIPSLPISGPAGAPSGQDTAAAAGFSIAFCLEGQLRLDDQPALHEAVALARHQPGSRLVVLATRPEGQRLRGPHQRRIEAQALASLRSRLADQGIPLLAFPQQTTAAALDEIRPLLRPDRLFQAQQSRLFGDWPIAPGRFPLVFSDFRRSLERPPEAPLPPPDLGGLGWTAAKWPEAWPQEWLGPVDVDPAADLGPFLGAAEGIDALAEPLGDPLDRKSVG
jgi:deoxyribodipyrimidine photo-lyase